MKWQDKDVNKLTDDELSEAKTKLEEIYNNYQEKRNSAKFAKKMKGQPEPIINPAFTTLLAEINTEIGKRNA